MKQSRLLLGVLCLISQFGFLNVVGRAYNRAIRPCPVVRSNPNLAEGTTLPSYAQAILDFLSKGGTPDELEHLLIIRKIVQPYAKEDHTPINPAFLNRGGVRVADFNGDGYLDVVVSLFDPSGGYVGALFVYICNGQNFHQIPSPLLYAVDPYIHKPKYIDRAPKFIYVGDMNNDGRAELVFDIGVEGASTVFEDVQIVGWNNQTQDMRPLKADQNSYPADGGYYKVVNATNGLKALVLRTGFSGSGIASGPQRPFTLTYAWDGRQFVEVSAVGDPSPNRLHVAYDALTALNHGNLKTATLLYNAVINNNHLEDWENWVDMRNLLMTHAAYGLVLTRAKQFGIKAKLTLQAYEQLEEMSKRLHKSQELWLRYGEIFWQSAQTKKALHSACLDVDDAIQADIKALPQPGPGGIQQLGIWPWFTYNVNWIPTDRGLSFCPF